MRPIEPPSTRAAAPIGSASGARRWSRKSIYVIAGRIRGAAVILALTATVMVVTSIVAVPGPIGFLGAGLGLLTLAIAAADARSFVIPDGLTAAGLALALAHAAAQEPDAPSGAMLSALMRGATLALLFLAFRALYGRLRGRQGLGLGDVKLAGMAGAWLDWASMPIAVELAAVAGLSAYMLRRKVLNRPLLATNRVPFGLFFAPAVWVCWLLEAIWLGPL
jgi:leader peptidase (prepilin peptidase) / N-methyltransferase